MPHSRDPVPALLRNPAPLLLSAQHSSAYLLPLRDPAPQLTVRTCSPYARDPCSTVPTRSCNPCLPPCSLKLLARRLSCVQSTAPLISHLCSSALALRLASRDSYPHDSPVMAAATDLTPPLLATDRLCRLEKLLLQSPLLHHTVSSSNAHGLSAASGSTRIGRIIMTAAAKHLTPVCLELGGKCPAIIDSLSRSRDIKVAINRIAGAKWGFCSGQACIAIDYLLVEEKYGPFLVDLLKDKIKNYYLRPGDLTRIVNKQHFQRLREIIEDPVIADTVVHGGSLDEENLYIEPTILLDPPLDSEIMKEEIFGPLLPIITLKKIEDSIEFLKARPKPLVIYAFTNDEKLKKRIVEETSSGSVTFNDAVIQFALDTLPFGGTGQSGFGKYHGKFSFDQFSHRKAVMRRSFYLEFLFRYPPWNERKLQFIRYVYSFNYVGLLLLFLGLKRCSST